jgi:hypothetical protein
MTLPLLPADYSLGDTPLADEINAIKAHAAYHVERLTTVLRRTGTVQPITFNALTSANAISWNTVVSGRNGMGWAIGTPTRIPCPSGGDGRYQFTLTAQMAAGAGGFRYTYLAKNGSGIKPGLFAPGDGTLTAWLATTWETELAAGDYVEVWLFQNRTAWTSPGNHRRYRFGESNSDAHPR